MGLFAVLVRIGGVLMRLLRVLYRFIIASLLVKLGCLTMRLRRVFMMLRCLIVLFVSHKTSSGDVLPYK
jgi:hypothetical protein